MARYVSKYRRYSITARPQRETLTIDGIPMVAQEQIVCDFQHGGLTDWEIKAALDRWEFRGIADGSNAWERLSVYDTGFHFKGSDSDRDYVEEFLDRNQGEDFMHVDKPALAPPWPNYPKLKAVAKIVTKIQEDGYDPEYVVMYEAEQPEPRLEVIDAMRALLSEPKPEQEEIHA